MAKVVIKKDGTKEAFDAEKIRSSIAAAAERTDLPAERKNEVVEQVSNLVIQEVEEKEEVATSEIREKILNELDLIEPSISSAWREYEQSKI